MMGSNLLSLNDAVKFRITRLRLPHWSNPRDYIRIEITEDGELGPRLHLYSPALSTLGTPNPLVIAWASIEIDPDRKIYLPHMKMAP
jgi:hypothetical protein